MCALSPHATIDPDDEKTALHAVDAFREGTRAAAITPANIAGEGEGLAEAMAEWLAGFDEGLLSLSLPIIVYIENSYMDKIYSDE